MEANEGEVKRNTESSVFSRYQLSLNRSFRLLQASG